jgi:hypothetical protein
MTIDYVDLDEVHEPAEGALVPVAWAHGIRSNFDYLYRPPYLVAQRTQPGHSNIAEREEVRALPDDTIEEITWDTINDHSGDFFELADGTPSIFSVPLTGMYFLSCKVYMSYDDLTNAEARTWLAAVVSDDDESSSDVNYILRQSGDIGLGHTYLGGMVRLTIGQSLRFSVYQDTGDNAHYGGYCSVVYLGGV